MKRPWIITIAVCLLLAAVVAVAVLLPRTVPEAECSDVYRRYAGRDDVAAGYIRDYRINDTVSVDVTVLEAQNDTAWSSLLNDFGIPPMPQEIIELVGLNVVDVRSSPKYDYSQPRDSVELNNDETAVYWVDKKIYVFHITSLNQIESVRHSQYDESIKRNKFKKHEKNN